ncbi:hypothetical protein [Parasediminibacterium sp. JCM 36343]|uniref:hypothetical protein n=1 Tax=Parasediminibacterium sp. JCM 36343 TaxID=3374279 RepID=UPI00397934D5
MNYKILMLLLVTVIFCGCKKEYDVQPTYAKNLLGKTWAQDQQYYSPHPELYIDSTGKWMKFISFSFTSTAEPDKIGFMNPNVPGKGTNALGMNSIYTKQGISQDSGTYNVIIPKCFQFIPKSADSTGTGTVVVLPQGVTITRRDKTKFIIYISPSTQSGTYNTDTGIFEIEVSFDETSIGGAKDVKRKYRFTS